MFWKNYIYVYVYKIVPVPVIHCNKAHVHNNYSSGIESRVNCSFSMELVDELHPKLLVLSDRVLLQNEALGNCLKKVTIV